nr:hypothetical protein [Clostridia bacterium]
MKYLQCKKCGAIVKEIVPCNCGDCGIRCCGEKMAEVKGEYKGTGKILTCSACGAKVEVVKDCTCENCGFTCCNQKMQ